MFFVFVVIVDVGLCSWLSVWNFEFVLVFWGFIVDMVFDVRICVSDFVLIVIIEVFVVVFVIRFVRFWIINGIVGLYGKFWIYDFFGIVIFGVVKVVVWIELSVSLVGLCFFDRVYVCVIVVIEIRVVYVRFGMIIVVDRWVNFVLMIGWIFIIVMIIRFFVIFRNLLEEIIVLWSLCLSLLNVVIVVEFVYLDYVIFVIVVYVCEM